MTCSLLLSILLSVPSLLPHHGTYKPLGSIKKARETGFTGMADECIYDFTTGRLLPKTGISLSY